jgi:Transposase
MKCADRKPSASRLVHTCYSSAISLDASSIYKTVAAERIPCATICLDPFHVIGWAGEVIEAAYRSQAPQFPLGDGRPSRRDWRHARYALRAGKERLDQRHHAILGALTCTGSSSPRRPPATSNGGAPPRYAAASPPTPP